MLCLLDKYSKGRSSILIKPADKKEKIKKNKQDRTILLNVDDTSDGNPFRGHQFNQMSPGTPKAKNEKRFAFSSLKKIVG